MAHVTAPSSSPSFCSEAARPWILLCAILISALGFIDGTVIAIAVPAMRETLDASLVQAQWFSNAYMLPLSALILVGGAFGDRYGIARTLMLGLGIFLVASVVSAMAPSPEVLIAGRALKGIGAALMVPGSLALIARAYPAETRGRAIGVWAAASAVTTAIGPVLGGAILSLGSPEAWRLIFALNLPLGAFVIWLLYTRVGQEPRIEVAPLDWIGAFLASASLGLFAYALSVSTSGVPMMTLAAAIGSGGLFLFWQARTEHPMMPLDLFRNRAFSAANGLTFFLYFGLSAVLFYQPMLLISSWGISELEASAAFIPISVFIGALSSRVGILADRHGSRPLITLGAIIVAIAFISLGFTAGQRNYWGLVIPLNALMGFGMALLVGPLSTTVMGSVPESRSGAASGINNALSRVAGLVAVASMGSVAVIAYHYAGGTLSFGESSASPEHGVASDAAFTAVAYIVGFMALISAGIAWWGIGPKTSLPT